MLPTNNNNYSQGIKKEKPIVVAFSRGKKANTFPESQEKYKKKISADL